MLCMLLVTLGFVSGCQGRQEASSAIKQYGKGCEGRGGNSGRAEAYR